MFSAVVSRVYLVITWFWTNFRSLIIPTEKAVGSLVSESPHLDVHKSSSTIKDLQDALGASFEPLASHLNPKGEVGNLEVPPEGRIEEPFEVPQIEEKPLEVPVEEPLEVTSTREKDIECAPDVQNPEKDLQDLQEPLSSTVMADGDKESVRTVDVEDTTSTYVLRIDTSANESDLAGGFFKSTCVNDAVDQEVLHLDDQEALDTSMDESLTGSEVSFATTMLLEDQTADEDDDESFIAVPVMVTETEMEIADDSTPSGEETGEVDSFVPDNTPMANMADGKLTNGYMMNGHRSLEETDESLSTSSASEVDSLEKVEHEDPVPATTKTVSEHAAYFKSLVLTEIKGSGGTLIRNGVEDDFPREEIILPKWRRSGVETVIEREIRLQKEREESLNVERQAAQMAALMLRQGPPPSNGISNGEECSHLEACEAELAEPDDLPIAESPVPGDIVVIDLPAKRPVKVRPVINDVEEVGKGSMYQVSKESPVEREIRQSLEREEELRKEKGLSPVQQMESLTIQPQQQPIEAPLTNGHSGSNKLNIAAFPSVRSRALDLLSPTVERSLQRKLATSRIQQEIEEQNQRELALRAEGAIRTTSEDHVDGCLLGRIGGTTIASSSPVPDPPQMVSPPSLPSTPDSELTDPGTCSPASAPSATSPVAASTNGHRFIKATTLGNKNSGRMFIRANSASSITNGVVTLPRPAGVKGVMQKFISSRGKVVPAFANRQRSNSINPFFPDGDLCARDQLMDEIRAPPPRNARRMYCSAESKIQAELQQLKAREEELRLIRAKQLAQSQPNLSTICGEDSFTSTENEENQVNGMGMHGRANSNPNLLDDSSLDSTEEQVIPFKPAAGRRRSALIAQWEEKIMQQNNDN